MERKITQNEKVKELFGYEERNELTWKQRGVIEKKMQELYGLTHDEAFVFVLYCTNLDVKPEDLKEKKVLDVGSGSGYFKKSLEKIIGKSDFVNFDRDIFEDEDQSLDVLGLAESLPFKDESFDLILTHCSTPVMLATGGNFELIAPTVKELLRVVSRGGTIKIYPVDFGDKELGGLANPAGREMFGLIKKEIQEADRNFKFKIIKIKSELGDYGTLIEIKKN